MKKMYEAVVWLTVLFFFACSDDGSAVAYSDEVDSNDSDLISEDKGSSGKSSSNRKEDISSSSLWDWTSPKEELFNPDVEYGTLTDSRDGKTYRTVTFVFNDSSMTWMAENLNYSDSVQSPRLKGQTSCLEQDPDCRVAGRNYTWLAAVDTTDEYCGGEKYCGLGQDNRQGICPDGWHLPGYKEWGYLRRFDINSLLSAEAFEDCSEVGDNETGFSALPVARSCKAVFWSSSEYDGSYYYYDFRPGHVVIWHGGAIELSYFLEYKGYDKEQKYPVRCVKNSEIRPYKNLWHWGLSKESFFNPDVEYGTLVDARDGQEYRTVVIGDQEWMAENLNYAVDSSRCYMDVSHYCDKVGRYYKWSQAMDTTDILCSNNDSDSRYCGKYFRGEYQGICPEGWHIPSSKDWDSLRQYMEGNPEGIRYAGSVYSEEYRTKWRTALYWVDDTIPNLNSTGLSVFPAGYFDTKDAQSEFTGLGKLAVFWMTEMKEWSAKAMSVGEDYSSNIKEGYRPKTDFVSVRCVKNRAQSVETD